MSTLAVVGAGPKGIAIAAKARALAAAGLPAPRDDSVHRTIVLPNDLAGRLAAEAGRRGISLSEDSPARRARRGGRSVQCP